MIDFRYAKCAHYTFMGDGVSAGRGHEGLLTSSGIFRLCPQKQGSVFKDIPLIHRIGKNVLHADADIKIFTQIHLQRVGGIVQEAVDRLGNAGRGRILHNHKVFLISEAVKTGVGDDIRVKGDLVFNGMNALGGHQGGIDRFLLQNSFHDQLSAA